MQRLALILSQALPAPQAGGAPEVIQLVPLGRFVYAHPELTQGKPVMWEITSEDVAEMIATKDAADVVLDYEHQTLGKGEAPAAGWIRELLDGGPRGLLGRVKWTEKAAGQVARGEYRYTSPVVLRNLPHKTEQGRTMRAYLHSAALTNRPYHPAIEALAASQDVGPVCALEPEEKSMDDLKEFLAKIIAALKLPVAGEATAETVLAATQQLVTDAEARAAAVLKDVREALGLAEGADLSGIKGTIAALKQGHEQQGTLAAEVAALKADLRRRDAAVAVAAALSQGKITPAQKDWAETYAAQDPAAFAAFVAKAPVVIDTGRVVPGGKPTPGPKHLDDTALVVAKMMGVSPEDLAKYN
jgi:phage I-like protein